MRAVRDAYATSATPVIWRDRAELRHALDGLTLVEPGLVDVADWPGSDNHRPPACMWAAVGLIP